MVSFVAKLIFANSVHLLRRMLLIGLRMATKKVPLAEFQKNMPSPIHFDKAMLRPFSGC